MRLRAWPRFAHKDIRDDCIVGNAGAGRVGLLRARFWQSIHRLDRAQDIDVSDAFAFE